MPTFTSPVDEFPGTVTFPKRLTMPQALQYEKSVRKAQGLEDPTQSEYDMATLPIICDVVVDWNLRDEDGEDLGELTPQTFPGSPRSASARLVGWLITELSKVYWPREDQDPNG